MRRIPLRWIAITVFLFSSTLNYLDRQILAAVAPALRTEFHISNADFGRIVSVFSIVYALTAPFAGWFIDTIGLNAGAAIAVLTWSAAGAMTGLTRSFTGLLTTRTMLGISEAAGIPCFGKANALYLEPRELALGTAFNQIGISLGMTLAPLIVAWIAPIYGWRGSFVFCGALALIWVPAWLFTSRKIPAKPAPKSQTHARLKDVLRDPQLWALVASTVLMMPLYSLWSNWTTLYFVEQWHLTQEAANARFAWIPPVFSTVGGFFGGWMAFHWIRGGARVIAARMRVCWICAIAALVATAAIPLMPTIALAAAAISVSSFWGVCITTNLYALPIDMFGPARAAFGVAALTFSYGMMQTVLSPAIGYVVDHFGFNAVCLGMAAMPLAGVWILSRTAR
jgi:MFS transporter, ACS family, hexuronate transporter